MQLIEYFHRSPQRFRTNFDFIIFMSSTKSLTAAVGVDGSTRLRRGWRMSNSHVPAASFDKPPPPRATAAEMMARSRRRGRVRAVVAIFAERALPRRAAGMYVCNINKKRLAFSCLAPPGQRHYTRAIQPSTPHPTRASHTSGSVLWARGPNPTTPLSRAGIFT